MRLVEIRRVSTEEQAREDRAGLDRQEQMNARRAERLGAELLRPPFVLTDVCRINFVDTPEWKQIERLISDPNVHLVVDTIDRIVAGLEGMPILLACQRTQTRIYTHESEIDPGTMSGMLLASMQAIIAGNELGSIRHRIQESKEAKRRAGIFPSFSKALPTGIAFERSKGADRKVTGRWTYTAEIERVREVFQLVVHEGVRNWAEVGRRTGFSEVTTRNILKNPIYKGEWAITKKRAGGPVPIKPDGRRKDRPKVARAPHEIIRHEVFRPRGAPVQLGDTREEAAVDPTTWEAAQAIVDAKRSEYHKPRETKGDNRFIYTGFLWCAGCNVPIWGKTRRAKNGDYYACKMATEPGEGRHCETTRWLGRAKVNAALDRLFATVLSNENLLRGFVKGGLDEGDRDDGARRSELERKRDRLSSQKTKLLDLYLSSTWSPADLDRKRQELDRELGKVERELRTMDEAKVTRTAALALEGLREALLALVEFEFWTTKQKRDLLRKFFPRIVISKAGVEAVQVRLPIVTKVDGRELAVPEHELPLDLKVGMTWEQLGPPIVMAEFGLPVKSAYTRDELRGLLGWSEWKLVDRMKEGLIPRPAGKIEGRPGWTIQQVGEVLLVSRNTEAPALC